MMKSQEEPITGVVIAVLTFRRTELLIPLIAALREQLDSARDPQRTFRILVVDNDPEGSGRRALEAAGSWSDVTCVIESRRGIAAARNRALDEAAADRLLVFIDDDEVPDDGWLSALLQTYYAHEPAAIAGPVRTVYLGEVDPWVIEGGFVDRSHRDHLRTGDVVAEAATNNLLLDLDIVRLLSLRFDETLGLGSGEDSLFTRRLTESDQLILWCADAWVSDLRPAERTTRLAALRRSFSFANSSARVQLRLATGTKPGQLVAACKIVFGAAPRMLLGSVQFLAGSVGRRVAWQANGARLVAKGSGQLTGALGLRYEEYGTSRRLRRGRSRG